MKRFLYTCDKCGRTIKPAKNRAVQKELADWLIGQRRGQKDPDVLVQRCPRHITDWALLNTIGYRRTYKFRRWAGEAKRYDIAYRGDRPLVEMVGPYPVFGPFSDEDVPWEPRTMKPVRIVRKKSKKSKKARSQDS